MSKAMLNIYVRTVRRRMQSEETLEDILAGYPRLAEYQKEEIRNEIFK